jgi:transposase InsO family protein
MPAEVASGEDIAGVGDAREDSPSAKVCHELGMIRSRGPVGTSADNAAADWFNASLKRETLQGAKRWPGARAARLAVFRWVTRCNTRGRHSSFGQISPITYDQLR